MSNILINVSSTTRTFKYLYLGRNNGHNMITRVWLMVFPIKYSTLNIVLVSFQDFSDTSEVCIIFTFDIQTSKHVTIKVKERVKLEVSLLLWSSVQYVKRIIST